MLGATNYSHWAGAGELRACLSRGGAPAELVKEAALRRLRSFLHVGVQEALDDSLVTLAAQLGLSLASPAYKVSCPLPSLLSLPLGSLPIIYFCTISPSAMSICTIFCCHLN